MKHIFFENRRKNKLNKIDIKKEIFNKANTLSLRSLILSILSAIYTVENVPNPKLQKTPIVSILDLKKLIIPYSFCVKSLANNMKRSMEVPRVRIEPVNAQKE